MDNLKKRILLFLIGCVGVRLLIAYLAKIININYLPVMGYIAMLPAIGFAYIFLTGSRKTGAEVFGGKIWWNNLRPIHAILYALFAYNAINKNPNSWKILLADVIFGLIAFIIFHYSNGDFAKL